MASSLHVLLFPFMAKGHTIPILQLTRLFLRRNATVTLFTTPSNHPYISAALSDTPTTIISLPFPQNIPGISAGVESTDKLPSMSLFLPFVSSTKLIKPHFEQALHNLQTPVTFMVTDGFFGWTLDSANKFNIPRLVYYGMSNFAITMSRVISHNPNLFTGISDTDEVIVPEFPWMKVTRIELGDKLNSNDVNNPIAEWMTEQIVATSKSYGLITNSFFELEPVYADFWNSKIGPKSWSVGPFCFSQKVVDQPNSKDQRTIQRPSWMVWLDEKLQLGNPVLYLAFGSQSEISVEQIEEIEIALERSEVNFLWVVRGETRNIKSRFEERVKGRGVVVREWVNQREILEHESVTGFVSHCGWNSVLESICAAVPIVAWPMMAEQPMNAKFVVEEMGIGVRVESCDGSLNGFVKWEELEKRVRELMEGEKGKEMRKKVKEISAASVRAVEDGGSSWRSMNELIEELQAK
ncbi:hypothetical protein L6452_10933 [Arctium lappa]|uniref:Uncharacterized protein n=1 Tax=Arctium lappa TaxID=4217 RepID=A0ACB9DNN4_ARCLA|nr:hypothetical protein L6452_10933 [Arctium lappa]